MVEYYSAVLDDMFLKSSHQLMDTLARVNSPYLSWFHFLWMNTHPLGRAAGSYGS